MTPPADTKKGGEQVAKYPHLQNFFVSKWSIYFCVALFSFYVAGMLRLTDHFLAKYISGYEFSGSYLTGLVVFFCAATVYLHLARHNGWVNWRYYILGSLVVFFPLVFAASAIKLLVNPNAEYIHFLNQRYCEIESSASLCGFAFASLVSSMSLRALPVVLSAPTMFWYALTRSESVRRAQE